MRYLPLLAVGAVLACGCGTPSGGDPGDKRLRELGDDPVFEALPAGASSPVLTRTRARYTQPAFSGGGWDGPGVVSTFGWSGPPRTVFRFFARRATAAGWHAASEGAFYVTDSWTKTYPDSAAATLLLTTRPVTDDAGAHTYSLSGSISLPQ
jgi:hypothetical protein